MIIIISIQIFFTRIVTLFCNQAIYILSEKLKNTICNNEQIAINKEINRLVYIYTETPSSLL